MIEIFLIVKFKPNYEMWLPDTVIKKSDIICNKEEALEFYRISNNLYKSDLINTRCYYKIIDKERYFR